jgi:hypothetical protein
MLQGGDEPVAAYAAAAMDAIAALHGPATGAAAQAQRPGAAQRAQRGRLCAAALVQLSSAVCPEAQEACCEVVLDKSPSQEDFIRGSMGRQAFSSKEVGGAAGAAAGVGVLEQTPGL